MSLKHYDLVWIEWLDAEHEGAWSHPDDEAKHAIAPCESVGWIVHQNETRLILSASTAMNHEGDIAEVGNKQIIPRGMIKVMKVLKRKSNARGKQKSRRSK